MQSPMPATADAAGETLSLTAQADQSSGTWGIRRTSDRAEPHQLVY